MVASFCGPNYLKTTDVCLSCWAVAMGNQACLDFTYWAEHLLACKLFVLDSATLSAFQDTVVQQDHLSRLVQDCQRNDQARDSIVDLQESLQEFQELQDHP